MATPVVAAINPNAIDAAAVVGTRIISAAAMHHVGALHVAASARVHDARPVALGHDCAAAANILVDLHSVAVDGANLPVWPDARRPAALQRYGAARSVVIARACAFARHGCATIAGWVPGTIAAPVAAGV